MPGQGRCWGKGGGAGARAVPGQERCRGKGDAGARAMLGQGRCWGKGGGAGARAVPGQERCWGKSGAGARAAVPGQGRCPEALAAVSGRAHTFERGNLEVDDPMVIIPMHLAVEVDVRPPQLIKAILGVEGRDQLAVGTSSMPERLPEAGQADLEKAESLGEHERARPPLLDIVELVQIDHVQARARLERAPLPQRHGRARQSRGDGRRQSHDAATDNEHISTGRRGGALASAALVTSAARAHDLTRFGGVNGGGGACQPGGSEQQAIERWALGGHAGRCQLERLGCKRPRESKHQQLVLIVALRA